ncbi:HAD family hydrolase [Occallatibacter riparius]|uniref:HAD family phosphatase n=1 Tax=Occallatibacter riparius TaxID=1002689 RepID=A0A9J7BXQ3_9BACT|nr:HAD family phosphatase [Occallatibacter riparius]UWZ85830.1 HAD family phosphatase [Occallatibacter riparius]
MTTAKYRATPQALIFDFDGVLADTEPLYWRAWCELLKPCNIDFTWADYCRIGRGIRDENMLSSLAELISDPDAMHRLKERLPERKEIVRRWKLAQPPIAEATIALLHSVARRSLGLVTSSDRSDIEPLLHRAGIAECFTACVFGDEITAHKPDPAPYLLMREKLQVSGGIVFEDSDAGLKSAADAGFDVVRVESPDQLPALVHKLLNRDSGGKYNERT